VQYDRLKLDDIELPKEFLPRDASAERGNATVSRPSVRLSVRDVWVSATHKLEFWENNFTAE